MQQAYGRLPLSFEPNRGQFPSGVAYVSRGRGYSLALRGDEASLALRRQNTARAASLRVRLLGARRDAPARPADRQPGVVNYLLGRDRSRWRTGVPTFGRVRFDDVYPGVDVAWYGNQRTLEYDLVVAPGRSAGAVRLFFAGAKRLRVDRDGDLRVALPGGEMRQRRPVVYQQVGGRRRPVAGRYVLRGPRTVGFRIGRHDSSRPLVIDPVLPFYATYLGGSGADAGEAIDVDAAGNAYIAGWTFSADFPLERPIDRDLKVNSLLCDWADLCPDAFVTKINAAGTAIVYSTFVGGDREDRALDLDVDADGNAYVTGGSNSGNDFPTVSAWRSDARWGDAFVFKLDPTGQNLAYSTWIGAKQGRAVVIDASGAAYVAGAANGDVPVTTGAAQQSCSGGCGFVTKIAPSGSSLVWSTYLGGSGGSGSQANDLALDAAGNVYVTGTAWSSFPTTPGAFSGTYKGYGDAFAAKLNPTGSAVLYATLLGGGWTEDGTAIGVDAAGDAYVAGTTRSSDFPTTPGAWSNSCNGWGDLYCQSTDAFVTKVNPSGTALLYSTFFGGSGDDVAGDMQLDGAGNVYLTGATESTNFPVAHAFQPAGRLEGCSGAPYTVCYDAFVTKLNADSSLGWSTYLGGDSGEDGSDFARGLALDASGHAYVTGSTSATDFPTLNAAQAHCGTSGDGLCDGGAGDAFAAKLGFVAPASSCSLDGQVLTVAVPPGGAVTFARSGSSLAVTGAGNCPAVSLTDVATVNTVGSAGNDTVTLDLSGGLFTPGARSELDNDPEIEFTASLGAGTDTLVLQGGQADDVIDLSSYGIDLNDDHDWDVTRLDNERTVVAGGPGADMLWAADYPRPVTVSGGDGNDAISGGWAADVIHGDAGNDYLDGSYGDDVVYGDGGADIVFGGGGNDLVDGGDGDDRFDADYDPGADVFRGGAGVDSVIYAARTTPVHVSLDNVAKDGANGEGDDVRDDVEVIYGGQAGDDVVGSAGDNTILARDGVADTIACGDGTDTVSADGVDTVAGDCENVSDAASPPTPPPNDDLDNAFALSRATWSFSGSTVAATKQLGEPDHAGFAGGHSVWFRWTAPRDGRARVNVFNGASWDSLLGVYTGASVGALTQVAANDDAPYGSQVSFNAVAGTRYWIAVDGKNGATGTFEIQTQLVDSEVPNDDFADAQVLSGSSGSVTGTLAGATSEPGEPNVNSASIWYRFTAPQDGALTLDLTGSAYSMPMQIYSGGSLGTLTAVPIDQSTYERTVGLQAGVTYSIQVSDDVGTLGRVALAWRFGVPVSDNFANARWINNWSDSTYDTNRGATKEPGEPNHAGQTGGHSVWFRLTAYTSQPIELHTSGSTFDTVLAVYTGATVGALTLVAENDDLAPSATYSFVRFTPVPGRVYSIAVDGKAGATGWVYLHQYPGNGSLGYDFFGDAAQLSGVTGSTPASNLGAGKERGEPDHTGDRGGASVWWKWTPPVNGTATIETAGSAIDTVLAVYTGERVEALTLVAANDNDGARATSKVSFPAVAGTTYRVAVDGKDNGLDVAEGALTLDWSLSAEKNAPSVSLTAPAAGSTVGGQTTISASASDDTGVTKVEFLINGTVWYTDATAPYAVTWNTEEFANGAYTLTAKAYDVVDNVGTSASRTVTVSTPPNTILDRGPAEYTTDANASFFFYASRSGTSFACSLDGAAFAACSTGIAYSGLAEGAHTFRVRASDAGGADPTPASSTWTVLKSSNDAFAAAKAISGDRGSVHGTVLGATKEAGEPDHGGQPGGTSVWYRWTAPAGYRVQFDTEGSDFDTLLGVYTGGSVSTLTTVVTDNDSGSYRASRVSFDAVAGTTYRIAVDRVYGSYDTFELRWAPHDEQVRPANDDFANAQALTGAVGTVSGSNGGATKEPLEPVYVGGWIGGASVWYGWTAPASGPVAVDTAGSRFSSVLGVYTGPGLGSLTLVAEDDDTFDDGAFASFNAVAGTTYRILVDGEGGGATGTIVLNWQLGPPPPPNDLFANAQIVSGEGGSVSGTTVGAGWEYDEPYHAGNPGGASIWYSWTASQTGLVTVDTIGSNFDTTLGVYEGDTLAGLQHRASDDDSGGGGTSRASWEAVAGHAYRIAVDGYSRAGVVPTGTVRLTWSAGGLPPDTANPAVSLTEPASGDVLHGPATLSATATDDVAVARVEFLVDGTVVGSDEFEPYSVSWDSATVPSGPATVTARAVDTAGKTATSSHSVTIDNTPPDTTITSGPAASTTDPNARFEFTASEPASFECKLDAADWWFCSSPQTYSTLAAGMHTFQVRAIDGVGQPDPTPATWTWTITAAAAPGNDNFENAAQLSGTSGSVAGTNIGATWQSGEPNHAYNSGGKSVWYRWQAPATGRVTFETTGDFTHGIAVYTGSTLTALALVLYDNGYLRTWTRVDFDATAGVIYRIAVDGAYGSSGLFTLNWSPPDTTPPETAITTGPSGTVASRTATFTFDSSEAGGTFECALDGGSFDVCTSPATYWGTADGGHTFRVRAVDRAGNADPTPASRSWIVDATPPETTIDSGPAGTTSLTSASFALSSSEPGGSFECALDGAAFAVCSSPKSYSGLALGSHTFEVRARDAVGNLDPTPAARSWTIVAADTTPPETTIIAQPSNPTKATAASFSFSSSEPGSTFRCRLDGASFAACTSPRTYGGLSEGMHSFEVAAVDSAGNVDPTPASFAWLVDTTPPQTTIDSGPAGATSSTQADFGFSSEPGASFECALDGAAFAPCSSPKSYSGLALGSHTFEVRTRDAVGNLDPTPAARSWTIEAADTTPPETTIDSGPPASADTVNATFVFSAGEPGSTFACRLDGGAWNACTSPQSYAGLGSGFHTFEVRATDPAGNVDQSPAAWSWSIVAAEPPPAQALPDLAAGVRASAAAARVGQTLTLTAVVSNRSAGAASGVTLTMSLPVNARLVSGAACSGKATLVCALGDLAGDSAASRQARVSVAAAGALVVRVSARSANGEANASDNDATLSVPAAAPLRPAVHTRRGTTRADVLRGTAYADRLYGVGGNDRLYGKGGDDRLDGGRGNDILVGGPGRDVIVCGPGRDRVVADRFDRVARDCESITRRGSS